MKNPVIRIGERGCVYVRPGTLVKYEGVGIFVNCALNEPEFGCQPFVTVNTEELPPAHTYDENDPSKPGGMPKIAVHLGDCTLYDDDGAGYKTDLRADGTFGDPQVHVVRPNDPAEDIAAFMYEEDAEAFAATYDDEAGDVERVTVCDRALAAKMIAEREEEEEEDEPEFDDEEDPG